MGSILLSVLKTGFREVLFHEHESGNDILASALGLMVTLSTHNVGLVVFTKLVFRQAPRVDYAGANFANVRLGCHNRTAKSATD